MAGLSGMKNRLGPKQGAVVLLLVIAMLLVVIAGSKSAPNAGSTKMQLAATSTPSFADNTASYPTKNEDEVAIIGIFKKIQNAYQGMGVDGIRTDLHPDFEYVYALTADNAKLDRTLGFLAVRQWWKEKSGSRKLSYAIQGMDLNKSRTQAFVIAIATYETKYFASRFLEAFTLEKVSKRWLVRKQTVALSAPESPESYSVQILVADPQWPETGGQSLTQQYPKFVLDHGPDWAIEKFRSKARDSGFPGDEKERSVLFVFNETPRPGSRIVIEHQFDRPNLEPLQPYRFEYVAPQSGTYYIIENRSHASYKCGSGNLCNGGTITYRVLIDGVKVGEKTITIQRP